MLRLAAVTATLVGLSMPALAQFSGDYAPGKWITSHLPNPSTDGGSVDTSLAPVSITLIGSNTTPFDPAFSALEFKIVALAGGTFSFDWSYKTNDIGYPGTPGDPTDPPVPPPFFDPAFVIRNGQILLTDNAGLPTQSGSFSVVVVKDDVIGFRIDSFDNYGGNATLTISNFMAPIPEPASVAMMSLGLLGVAVAAARRRRSN